MSRDGLALPLILVLAGCAGTASAPVAVPTDGPPAVHTDPPAGGDEVRTHDGGTTAP